MRHVQEHHEHNEHNLGSFSLVQKHHEHNWCGPAWPAPQTWGEARARTLLDERPAGSVMACEGFRKALASVPNAEESAGTLVGMLDSTNDSFLGFGALQTSLMMDVYSICWSCFARSSHS